jgi:ribosomal protein S27E
VTGGICPPCGRPNGSSCDACLSGKPPPERLAHEAMLKGGQCVRGCILWRKHLRSCTQDGCRGCEPRRAEHGRLCDQCHIRLTGWLSGSIQTSSYTPDRKDPLYWKVTKLTRTSWTHGRGLLAWHTGTVTVRRWAPSVGSLAWGYAWVGRDLEPEQGGGYEKIRRGKQAPPAAMAPHVYVLRQDICKALGQWLRHTTSEFNLHGPEWWNHRVEHRSDDESSWRSWLPQNQAEVYQAAKYLLTWLDRIEPVPDLVKMIYAEADKLVGRVAGLAPWEAKSRRMKGLECPTCNRESLALFEGSEHLTCLRCGEIVTRAKYDRWSALIESTKAEDDGKLVA